jgi:sigma-B regulation protein RsbU (phosphoserine phosphatase)
MLDEGGPPLGLFPESEYVSRRIYLQEGDVLVLYTDGILDTTNREHDQFGEERFRETIHSSLSLSASEICQEVADRMDTFSAGAPQWDDLTLVVVKLKSEVMDFPMVETKERNAHGD